MRGCSSDTSEGSVIAVLEGYEWGIGWEREDMEWGEAISNPAIDFLRVPASWLVRRSCRAAISLAWFEFRRRVGFRDWVGGAGLMPVRRDLTGYTYELEGWGDSSSPGVFLDPSSPSCMIERTW